MVRTIIERMKLERRITWSILAVLVTLALVYNTFFASSVIHFTSDDYPAEEFYFVPDSDQ